MSEAGSHWIKAVSLPPPSLQDNTADAERLIAGIKNALQADDEIRIDIGLIRKLPETLRRCDFHVRCILLRDIGRWLLVDIQPANVVWPVVGLAVDL